MKATPRWVQIQLQSMYGLRYQLSDRRTASAGLIRTTALEQAAPGMLRILVPLSICSLPQRPAAEWVAFASDSARYRCYQTASCYCYLTHIAAAAQLGFV